jgi:hypothetical protein
VKSENTIHKFYSDITAKTKHFQNMMIGNQVCHLESEAIWQFLKKKKKIHLNIQIKNQSHADLLSNMKRSIQCHSGILSARSSIFIAAHLSTKTKHSVGNCILNYDNVLHLTALSVGPLLAQKESVQTSIILLMCDIHIVLVEHAIVRT